MGERFRARRADPPLTDGAAEPRSADSGAAPLHETARRDLRARWRRFRAAARRVVRRADGEAIHDARVASRRLTAALRAWSPLLMPRLAKRAARSLRRVRRRLGAVRDLEVMLLLVESRVGRAAGAEAAAWAPHLSAIAAAVERGRTQAAHRVRPKRLRSLARRVRRAADSARPREDGEIALAASLAAYVAEARTRGLALLEEARTSDDDARLHAARIAIKKWRYSLECAREIVPPPDLEPVRERLKTLEALQEAFGAVHDLAVLRDLVAESASSAQSAEPAKRVAASIERERLAAAESARRLAASAARSLSASRV